MEILIIGGIIVALMVYASTRIKRTAAEAFEAETVDTEIYTIAKPDGFLNVIEPAAPLLFHAYSKEFGAGEENGIRQAVVELTLESDMKPEAVFQRDVRGLEVISDVKEIVGEHHYREIEALETIDDIDYHTFRKLAAAGRGTYVLKAKCLAGADEIIPKAELLVNSFELK